METRSPSKSKGGLPLDVGMSAFEGQIGPFEGHEPTVGLRITDDPNIPLTNSAVVVPVLDVRDIPELGQVLRIDHLPGRLRNMIATLLAHQADLLRYPTGSITLHFKDESLKAHITLQPPGEG